MAFGVAGDKITYANSNYIIQSLYNIMFKKGKIMKKILALFILLAFTSSTLAINANEVFLDKSRDTAFANNYQGTNAKSSAPGLSAVEQMFNGKEADLSKSVLRQIGYDYFSSSAVNGTSGKYGDDYKLNVGEKVSAYLYGESVDVMAISGANVISPVVNTEVDSKGNIFIQGIGIVPAEGRTLSQIENDINQMAAKKYNNMKVRLQVASGQSFSVFVYGQVNRPGKVLIANNSSLLDALGAAGGVKKTGSLRKITYTSGKKTKNVDLYSAIFAGMDDGIILKANDKIFVPSIGKVVAFKNGVTVPGIYEVKEGESLQKLVTYAGDLLAGTQQTEVTLTGLDTKTNERVARNISWQEAKNTKLSSGDIVEFKELYNTAENTVTIQGNIKHPATYAYKPGMRLSDILKSENELLEETFITQAVIRRVSGKNNTVETIPIFLKEFFAGMNDPQLQPKDIINIYKNTNSQYVDVYGCIDTPKHITYTENMKLDDILTDVQFIESNIDIPDEEKEEDRKDEENKNETKAAYHPSTSSALIGGTSNNNRRISAENVAVEVTGADGTTQLYYLYDIMVNSSRIKNIPLNPNDKVFFRTLRDNEFIKKVKVSGFVNNPGVFKFVEGKRLVDMINMADGLMDDADLRGIVYTRRNLRNKQISMAQKNNERDIKLVQGRMASAYKATDKDMDAKMTLLNALNDEEKDISNRYSGQIALNIKNNKLSSISEIDNLEVQDGDEIYIPRISKQVSVIGEVYNEQSFMYRPGRKARTYIKQVGGYTPNANKFRLYKVGVNGRAEKVRRFTAIEPGDTIVVPRRIAGNDYISPICSTLQGLASLFIMAFGISRW